jgi:hypothetical protein
LSTVEVVTVTVIVSSDIAESDVEDIVRALDEAGANATVGPFPGRMGLAADAVAMVVEITISALVTFVLTEAGRRVWTALTNAVKRRRHRPAAKTEMNQVAMVINDNQARVRLEFTVDDLADDRVQAELQSLGDLAGSPNPIVLRWDRNTAGYRRTAPER